MAIGVSIIIPVYNCEKYIDKCLRSISKQTYTDYELIIVDDGSTDNSVKAIKAALGSYKLYDKAVFIKQDNTGVSKARNNALDVAKGDYVVFIDGDDFVDKDYIYTLYNYAIKDNSDVVICGYKEVDESGNVIKTVSFDRDIKEVDYYKMMTTCMRIMKTELLIRYSIRFPEHVRGEDIPFNMMAYAFGTNIKIIDYVGYYYVQHSSSAMKRMVGLTGVNFPILEIAEIVNLAKKAGTSMYDLTEYAMLRSYAMFIFVFGRKAKKKDLYRIINEVRYGLNTVPGNYIHNPYINCKDFGIVQKYAVKLMCFFENRGLLEAFAYFFTRW